ncbi:hypothetical protein A2U01_0103611, partial [Trifolium medium]|nr:hypothetical protein [Trifolium medium]
PARAAPTPEENRTRQGNAARRTSPSCASRRHQKHKLPFNHSPARRASPSCVQHPNPFYP